MKNEHCIIAGGGICGLFASILLADKFRHVSIIEKEALCGGLLRSITDDNGVVYDQGTHVPNSTLIPEIDNILFGSETTRKDHWNELGILNPGNYFNGQWNLTSSLLDIRCLPQAQYQKIILELLERDKVIEADDLVTFLIETVGPTLTTEILAPIVLKLYGQDTDLSQLTTKSSVSYFGLNRVQALSPELTNKLKELPVYDAKFAYHTKNDFEERINQDCAPQSVSYYPKGGKGVGYWVDHLIAQANAKGVTFYNNEFIKKIEHHDKTITSVSLGNTGQTLECDFLFWTAPTHFALNAANLDYSSTRSTFKSACIGHFCVDKPLLNAHCHYLWNWDVNYKSFRITLYPNMQLDRVDKTHKVTVEALCEAGDVDNITLGLLFDELVNMGIIDPSSTILSQTKSVIHNTFPVPTFDFCNAVTSNYQQLNESLNNIHLAGRYAGKSWFHADVFKEVYNDIKQKFG